MISEQFWPGKRVPEFLTKLGTNYVLQDKDYRSFIFPGDWIITLKNGRKRVVSNAAYQVIKELEDE